MQFRELKSQLDLLERAALGSFFANPKHAERVEGLRAENFSTQTRGRLFQYLQDRWKQAPNSRIDISHVLPTLLENGTLRMKFPARFLIGLKLDHEAFERPDTLYPELLECAAYLKEYEASEAEKAANATPATDLLENPSGTGSLESVVPDLSAERNHPHALAESEYWSLNDLDECESEEQLWQGLLAIGSVTILHSRPKLGKSFTMFGLVKALSGACLFKGRQECLPHSTMQVCHGQLAARVPQDTKSSTSACDTENSAGNASLAPTTRAASCPWHTSLNSFPESEPAEFLGQPVQPGGVIWLTEESRSTLKEKRERFGIDKSAPVGFLSRRAPQMATLNFQDALEVACRTGRKRNARLLIVDTLGSWASLDSDAENHAARIEKLFHHIKAKAVANRMAAIVLHHTEKKGKSARGSTALEAAADTVLRLSVLDKHPNRRAITVRSRLADAPSRIEFEFVPETMEFRTEIVRDTQHEKILKLLPASAPGLTIKELIEKSGLAQRTIYDVIPEKEIRSSGRIRNSQPPCSFHSNN